MRIIGSKIVSALGAIGILSSSVPALANPAPTASAAQARDPWVTLSMLTPAGASALAGTASAAAQPDNPPPPPPAEGGGFHIPTPVLVIWLADIALIVYLATRHHSHGHIPPLSPG
jgi:hypothetical protein